MRRPKVKAVLAIALFTGLTCLLIWLGEEWRWQGDIQRAYVLQEESANNEEARILLIKLAQQRPNDETIAYWLGKCEFSLKHPQAALDAWSRLKPGSPKAGLAEVPIAELLITQRGQFTEAENRLKPLADKRNMGANDVLARLYRHEGRLDEVRTLLQGKWQDPKLRVEALRNLWQLDQDPIPVAEVRDFLNEAETKSPEDDRIWLGRANLETRAGNLGKAEALLDRCRKARPNDPAIALATLRWGIAADRPDVVMNATNQLKPNAIEQFERLRLRGWLAAQEGDRNREREALERLLEVFPGDTLALERLAAIASEAVNPPRALSLRRQKADSDNARERYRVLLRNTPDPSSYAELARIAEILGRDFEARGWWSLTFDPAAPAALSRLDARAKAEQQALVDRSSLTKMISSGSTGKPVNQVTSKAKTNIATQPTVRFQDDATLAKLDFRFNNGRSTERLLPETMSGGIGLIDYNNDGLLDVYAVQGGTFPPPDSPQPFGDRLFRNLGNGTFEDVTKSSGLANFPGGYGHGVAVGDVDNDGHPDIFVTRWRAYALYRNKGDGTFEDVTTRFGLAGDRDWPTSAAFADLDNDGDLDLYVCHYLVFDPKNPLICRLPDRPEPHYCDPRHFPALADHLFRNDGGKFVDVTAESGMVDKEGRGLGVIAADLDDDGKIDLFVANDTTANYLWHNKGGLKFVEVGVASGVACNAAGGFQAGMGTACADLDGDGKLDLLVTNFYGESTTYYHNLGHGSFSDETASIGLAAPSRFLLGFGLVAFDANNDGGLDVATANGHVDDLSPNIPHTMPAQLFLGTANKRLVDVSHSAGTPWTTKRLGRGLVRGDLDNDGRVDLLLVDQTAALAFFRNQSDLIGQHWISLTLQGTKSGRDAVGAVVSIEAGGRKHVAGRVGGGSYLSANDARLHFGLGEANKIDSLVVRWPSGRVEHFANLAIDRIHTLVEGSGTP